jgi:hypothetical protein
MQYQVLSTQYLIPNGKRRKNQRWRKESKGLPL